MQNQRSVINEEAVLLRRTMRAAQKHRSITGIVVSRITHGIFSPMVSQTFPLPGWERDVKATVAGCTTYNLQLSMSIVWCKIVRKIPIVMNRWKLNVSIVSRGMSLELFVKLMSFATCYYRRSKTNGKRSSMIAPRSSNSCTNQNEDWRIKTRQFSFLAADRFSALHKAEKKKEERPSWGCGAHESISSSFLVQLPDSLRSTGTSFRLNNN